jgi:NADH-quinone oxidoreductase subunit L
MEGPTPVSALIHAATMVTAGVYMVARCHALFDRSPYALGVVALIGTATALFAATIGCVQHDIKRVLAYSTVSQLGYMFLACGVAAYSAGIFHLMTHAFFKALLFLAAGSVIHAMSGEQDMRVMGGLRKRIPVTFWTMTAGVFAIAGIPPLSGFFSKDEILYRAYTSPNPLGKLLWFVGLVTAGLTSFYMFRLWFKTFFGPERFDENALAHGHEEAHNLHATSGGTQAASHGHGNTHMAHEAEHDSGQAAHGHGVHESPAVMTGPLAILAVLAIIGGWIGVPMALGGSNHFEHFLDPVFSLASSPEAAVNTAASLNQAQLSRGPELTLAVVSTCVALLGLFVAYLWYVRAPGTATRLARSMRPVYRLLDHKYWVDEAYGVAIVMPLLGASRILLGGIVEGAIVQGTGAGLAAGTQGLGWVTRRMQSGNIRSYAGWLALGAAVIIAVVLFGVHPLHR